MMQATVFVEIYDSICCLSLKHMYKLKSKRGQQMSNKFQAKILVIVAILLMTVACASSNIEFIPEETLIYGIDFKKYSQQGFLFTPGEYGGDYTALGLLTFSVYPEAEKITSTVGQGANEREVEEWKVKEIDAANVIELAYQEAVKMGANGITHLNIHFHTKHYPDGMQRVEVTGIKLDGLLIKRN